MSSSAQQLRVHCNLEVIGGDVITSLQLLPSFVLGGYKTCLCPGSQMPPLHHWEHVARTDRGCCSLQSSTQSLSFTGRNMSCACGQGLIGRPQSGQGWLAGWPLLLCLQLSGELWAGHSFLCSLGAHGSRTAGVASTPAHTQWQPTHTPLRQNSLLSGAPPQAALKPSEGTPRHTTSSTC